MQIAGIILSGIGLAYYLAFGLAFKLIHPRLKDSNWNLNDWIDNNRILFFTIVGIFFGIMFIVCFMLIIVGFVLIFLNPHYV